MNNKEMIEIASIRLALIAPAINNTFTEESKMAYYRRVAENPVKLPRCVFIYCSKIHKKQ